jgi:hypothetical protein
MPIALSSHGLYSNVPFPKAIPTSAKLKLFNLPCPCDQHELLEHIGSCGVDVESLEVCNGMPIQMHAMYMCPGWMDAPMYLTDRGMHTFSKGAHAIASMHVKIVKET